MEELPELIAVYRIVRGVEVKNKFRRHALLASQPNKYIDELSCSVAILEADNIER